MLLRKHAFKQSIDMARIGCEVFEFRFLLRIESLQVFPQRMRRNLEATRGTILSQGLLIALLRKGFSRREAYGIVQRASRRATEKEIHLFEALQDDAEAEKLLDAQEKAKLEDLTPYTRHVDTLFERVLAQ